MAAFGTHRAISVSLSLGFHRKNKKRFYENMRKTWDLFSIHDTPSILAKMGYIAIKPLLLHQERWLMPCGTANRCGTIKSCNDRTHLSGITNMGLNLTWEMQQLWGLRRTCWIRCIFLTRNSARRCTVRIRFYREEYCFVNNVPATS